jgi:CheY-like chemotaxis protein
MAPESRRILVVEDDPRDLELMLAALEGHGIVDDVMVVRDGAEAIEYLFRRGQFAGRTGPEPAVVFLDLKLPKIDGLQVLNQVKTDEALRAVPVVMLTSSREERDVLRSYDNGVNAYVVKPVDFDAFTETIKEIGLFWAVVNQPPVSSR